jgi:hypothetical protein
MCRVPASSIDSRRFATASAIASMNWSTPHRYHTCSSQFADRNSMHRLRRYGSSLLHQIEQIWTVGSIQTKWGEVVLIKVNPKAYRIVYERTRRRSGSVGSQEVLVLTVQLYGAR